MDEKNVLQTEGSSKEQRRLSYTRYLKLKRLPTLQEVLDRRTRPPLDLFCFYVSCPSWEVERIKLKEPSSETDIPATRIG